MNIQSAISKCDIARAILLALISYKKTASADADVIQSLSFAVEAYLDDAKEACENQAQPTPLYAHNDDRLLLGDRIQLARENLGLSEADLARQLNTYSDHVTDWESGITEPPASMIIPLANVLKCDPIWLLTGKTPEVAE